MLTAESAYWFSFAWLALLVVVAVCYGIANAVRNDYSFWENCLYLPTYLMGRLVWRVYFTNEAPKELAAGAILVANHRSSVDPFFVQLAARRRVHWMVAKEYCVHFLFGPILRAAQVIPTNRSGTDTASTKMAMKITKAGRLVGMFPEGALNHTTDPLIPIRSGAALVAIRSNVPMIPLYLKGSPYRREVWSPVFMPARVGITFGNAIFPNPESTDSDREQADSLIASWAKQVVGLSGQPDYPIAFASKRKRKTFS